MEAGSLLLRQAGRSAWAFYIGTLACSLAFAIPPTTTNLTISPSGTVSAGSVLTLTASVTSAGASVTRGLVIFCNAAAAHCEDAAVLGQAQLTSSGSAKLKLRLGGGEHSIIARFHGTTSLAASQSGPGTLKVTDGPSEATLTATGPTGAVTLTGTANFFGTVTPSGTLTLLDTAHGNALLGSAAIDAASTTSVFSSTAEYYYGSIPQVITTADFNADGIPDLAVAQFYPSNRVWCYLGVGDGTFNFKSSTPVGIAPTATASGDFNGDGIADLAVAAQDDTVTVLLGNGDGTFIEKSSLAVGSYPLEIVTGDFNGDGIPDIATINADDYDLTVLLGNGDGTFEYKSSPATGAYPVEVQVADLNGDGILDLVTANQADNTITVLLGNGDGTFTGKSLSSLYQVSAATIGDFNDDGIPDLVVANFTDLFDTSILILLGKGDGTFVQESMLSGSDFIIAAIVGDFNGDGVTDIVTQSQDDRSSIFYGKGDGTFLSMSSSQFTGGSVAAADLNGDGLSDIVLGMGSGYGLITAYLSEQTSTLSVNSPLPAGAYRIVASYSGDSNYAASTSPPVLLDLNPPADPVLSQPSGIYQWTQRISLTDSTPGVVIHYTLDGTTPTSSSPVYTSPIVIGWDGTINAIAIATSGAYSNVVGGTYTIDRPLPPPTFSLPSGTYTAPQSITLIDDPTYCGEHGAVCEIYYTLNGTTPTIWGSPKYTGPIVLDAAGTKTIKAIATSHHFMPSSVASATYTLH